MASSRNALKQISSNIEESIAGRHIGPKPELSPVASAKEIGRTPLRNFGRVELSRIVPDPDQPRRDFDEEEIDQLAETMKECQIQPIGVTWAPDIGKWMIVHGERRYRAAKKAGLKTIDCSFENQDLEPDRKLKKQLIENIQRSDLPPLDQANAFNELMQVNGWTGKQLAKELNITASKVSRSLGLLDLPDAVQAKIRNGELSRTTAYEIAKLDNDEVQKRIASAPLTQSGAQTAVRKARGKKSAKRKASRQLRFICENGWTIVAIPPKDGCNFTYHDMSEALSQTTDDVQVRITSNIRLL